MRTAMLVHTTPPARRLHVVAHVARDALLMERKVIHLGDAIGKHSVPIHLTVP
jgi:hypothetical protein